MDPFLTLKSKFLTQYAIFGRLGSKGLTSKVLFIIVHINKLSDLTFLKHIAKNIVNSKAGYHRMLPPKVHQKPF